MTKPNPILQTAENWLKPKEAARLLGVSDWTLKNSMTITYLKRQNGNRVYRMYPESAIRAYQQENTVSH